MRISFGIVTLLIVSSCHGSGFSSQDKSYFSEPPYITSSGHQYFINWRYGTIGCTFTPEQKVVNGALLLSLHATTSSGCVPGHAGSMHISEPEQIQAFESKGAFWQEPDGTNTKLEVR